jgi:hypothetical protein
MPDLIAFTGHGLEAIGPPGRPGGGPGGPGGPGSPNRPRGSSAEP